MELTAICEALETVSGVVEIRPTAPMLTALLERRLYRSENLRWTRAED
jgi:hypothetical protein